MEITLKQIEQTDYQKMSWELHCIDIALAHCIDNKNLHLLPQTLDRLKNFLEKVNWNYTELLRRPLSILHSILLTRTFFNRNFNSPIFDQELNTLRTFASTEEEFREVYRIYFSAIESSLIQEA